MYSVLFKEGLNLPAGVLRIVVLVQSVAIWVHLTEKRDEKSRYLHIWLLSLFLQTSQVEWRPSSKFQPRHESLGDTYVSTSAFEEHSFF